METEKLQSTSHHTIESGRIACRRAREIHLSRFPIGCPIYSSFPSLLKNRTALSGLKFSRHGSFTAAGARENFPSHSSRRLCGISVVAVYIINGTATPAGATLSSVYRYWTKSRVRLYRFKVLPRAAAADDEARNKGQNGWLDILAGVFRSVCGNSHEGFFLCRAAAATDVRVIYSFLINAAVASSFLIHMYIILVWMRECFGEERMLRLSLFY